MAKLAATLSAPDPIELQVESPDRSPICVDLDAALLRTSLTWESLILLVKQRPALVVQLPRWFMGGKAAFKAAVAANVRVNYDTLPLNEEVLRDLRVAHDGDRELALFSSASQSLVNGLAQRLKIFAIARGSDGSVDLSGPRKLEAMRQEYGDDFAYVGADGLDGPRHRASEAMLERLGQELPPPADSSAATPWHWLRLWTRALRVHQWTKNTLIFAPVVLAGPLASSAERIATLLGFLVFCLVSSTGYLANDLLDLENDRQHPSKRRRPFASGQLPPVAGLGLAPILLLTAMALCLLLPGPFVATAAAYLILTLLYSLCFRQTPILDVIVIAGLFVIRVLAGAVLLSKPVSYWLLTFAMLLFLSLALVKRYSELLASGGDLKHRGYTALDRALLLPFGIAGAVGANVILVIYLVNEHLPSKVFDRPEFLWLIFPLLLGWTMHVWRVTLHGNMKDDPVLFAFRDRTSLLLGGVVLALLALAW